MPALIKDTTYLPDIDMIAKEATKTVSKKLFAVGKSGPILHFGHIRCKGEASNLKKGCSYKCNK